MKLTQEAIKTLAPKPGQSEARFFDEGIPGFGVRIRANGAKTWIFQFQIGAAKNSITIGSAKPGGLSAADARKIATKHHAKVKLGTNPAEEKKASRQSRSGETFEQTMRTYLARRQEALKPRSYAEIERHLTTHAKPLHRKALADIDRRTIAARLAEIETESGPVARNRVRSSLSALFAWAVKEGIAESNPVVGTNKAHEQARDRVLSPDELRAIWKALGSDQYSAIIKLLMLTGQRKEEIGCLRRSELDLERAMISLPPARTKNRRPHDVPLSGAAQAVLEALPRRAGSDFVFGWGQSGWQGWSNSKEALDERISDTGKPLAPWTVHDLRRTVATGMAELGIAPHIIEAVLNHVSGHKAGVAGIYNRAVYENEKRAALALWAEHLIAVVEGRKAKVVSIRA